MKEKSGENSGPRQRSANQLPALDAAIHQAIEKVIADALPGSDPAWPMLAARYWLSLYAGDDAALPEGTNAANLAATIRAVLGAADNALSIRNRPGSHGGAP